jgi:hypothetical protein
VINHAQPNVLQQGQKDVLMVATPMGLINVSFAHKIVVEIVIGSLAVPLAAKISTMEPGVRLYGTTSFGFGSID